MAQDKFPCRIEDVHDRAATHLIHVCIRDPGLSLCGDHRSAHGLCFNSVNGGRSGYKES